MVCYYNDVKDKKNLYTPPSGGKKPGIAGIGGRI